MPARPVSLIVFQPGTRQTIAAIKLAEEVGIPGIWMPSLPAAPDPMPVLAAAAAQTNKVTLGTGVIISYTRHPVALANEALAMAELAPGRFRLGIGASHDFIVRGMYGIGFSKPLAHLREYMAVLRGMLWSGLAHFEGEYYQVHADYPAYVPPPRVPIMMAAVRPKMFRLAGELSDGAVVSWGTMNYLLQQALPAMEAGAQAAGRPRPPLIASAPVVLSSDFGAVRKAALDGLSLYLTLSGYIEMFELAGFPLVNGQPTDELIHELFVYGDAGTIKKRMNAMYDSGIDEIQVTIHPANDPVAEGMAIMEILGDLAAG
jgi:F420-dependent oxidoreductase-like protein